MTKEQVLKKLKNAKAKHAVKQAQYVKEAIKGGWVPSTTLYSPSLKYYTRLNTFKNANVEFNPTTMIATSYDWWEFVKVIKGKVVFNNYSYSNTTNRHQGSVKSLLRELGIKIDIEVNISGGLQKLDSSLADFYTALFQTEIDIKNGRPKTHRQSYRVWNKKHLEKQIKFVRSLGAKLSLKEVKKIKTSIHDKEAKRLQEIVERKAFLKNATANKELFKVA